jgi:hypothetical protein
MRGIDRVLAVILLLGAVGGAAAFARQTGSDATSLGVDLAAPPLQHVAAPGTFFVAPALTHPAKVAAAPRVTIGPAAPQQPAQAIQPLSTPLPPAAEPPATDAPPAATPDASTPAPPPAQAPAPAPAQTPEPPRVLTVAEPAAEPQDGKKKRRGHGHAWGHFKQDTTSPAPDTAAPETPAAPTEAPVVPVSPNDSSGEEHGNGHEDQGNGNGNEHGHGSGHDQAGDSKHSGD